jgi:integrase
MSNKPFTRLGIEAQTTRGRFADPTTRGPYLQVRPKPGGGVTRSFLFRYSFAGKSRDMGLGAAGTTSLKAAREAVEDARKLPREGVDPIAERQRKKAAEIAAASVEAQTFAEATEAWIKARKGERKDSEAAAKNPLAPIRRYLWPTLGKLDVRDIQHAHMILSTTRLNETFGAEWDEINADRTLGTIPAARMKKGSEHEVPVTARMRAILDRQAERRCSDLIFPGQWPDQPISPPSPKAALKRLGIVGITNHGWRSVWRDWSGDIGEIDRTVAEEQIAHVVGDATEQPRRRATALKRRRLALEAYGNWLCGETPKAAEVEATEATVVPFKRKAAG